MPPGNFRRTRFFNSAYIKILTTKKNPADVMAHGLGPALCVATWRSSIFLCRSNAVVIVATWQFRRASDSLNVLLHPNPSNEGNPADVMAHGLGPALCSHLAFKRFSVPLKCSGLSLPPGNFLLIPEKKKFPLALFEHFLPGGHLFAPQNDGRGVHCPMAIDATRQCSFEHFLSTLIRIT